MKAIGNVHIGLDEHLSAFDSNVIMNHGIPIGPNDCKCVEGASFDLVVIRLACFRLKFEI